jgi:hypothetical protein
MGHISPLYSKAQCTEIVFLATFSPPLGNKLKNVLVHLSQGNPDDALGGYFLRVILQNGHKLLK